MTNREILIKAIETCERHHEDCLECPFFIQKHMYMCVWGWRGNGCLCYKEQFMKLMEEKELSE